MRLILTWTNTTSRPGSLASSTDGVKLLGAEAFALYFTTSNPLLGEFLGLSGGSLHCVEVNLARRLRKLSADTSRFGVVENEVSKYADEITGILGVRWEEL